MRGLRRGAEGGGGCWCGEDTHMCRIMLSCKSELLDICLHRQQLFLDQTGASDGPVTGQGWARSGSESAHSWSALGERFRLEGEASNYVTQVTHTDCGYQKLTASRLTANSMRQHQLS